MTNVEKAIEQVESLFQKITGQPAPRNERPYAPLNQNADLGQQIERRMEELMITLQDPQLLPQPQMWNPPLSVWETETQFLCRLDIPGVKSEDIDMSVHGQVLTVRGIRRSLDQARGNMRPISVENTVGSFQRSILIPATVAATALDTRVEDGVLEIVLPKISAKTSGKTTDKVQ